MEGRRHLQERLLIGTPLEVEASHVAGGNGRDRVTSGEVGRGAFQGKRNAKRRGREQMKRSPAELSATALLVLPDECDGFE